MAVRNANPFNADALTRRLGLLAVSAAGVGVVLTFSPTTAATGQHFLKFGTIGSLGLAVVSAASAFAIRRPRRKRR